MTRAVVFDLDGTLADTARLVSTDRRRKPFDILSHSPPGQSTQELRFGDGRERLPGDLAALGYRVAIVTASPPAYASTLVDLLNIDFERLLAGGKESKVLKLRELSEYWRIDPAEMYYVGDRYKPPNSEDSEAAHLAGYEFLPVERIAELRDFSRITNNKSDPASSQDDRISCPNPHCNNTVSLLNARLGFQCPRCSAFIHSPQGTEIDGNSAGSQTVGAYKDLKTDPGRQDRRELQKQFLTHVSPEFRDCVIDLDLTEGRFQFPPWLLSKSEIRADQDLRELAMKATAQLLPMLARKDGVCVDSLVPYRGPHKALMQKLKDFTTKARGSGPEVHQSLGYLPALALAGHLHSVVERANPQNIALAPVPCRPICPDHPGEFSLRLAARVARLIDIPLLQVLDHPPGRISIRFKKDPYLEDLESSQLEHLYNGGLVILLDDQYTSGESMRDARRSLEKAGAVVTRAMTWSQSMRVDEHEPSGCMFERQLGSWWNDCTCPTKRYKNMARLF
ncbi:MAG: hypothetical protein CL389_13020 [Acidiferrobacteraceae bacterium]|nr:hypothetical protein [Acidiferrobacteraceae bacterium]